MKTKVKIIIIACGVILAGCATRTNIVGKEFDTTKIAEIKKGQTTTEQLQNLLGPPFDKAVKTADEETWTYYWDKETITVTPGWQAPNANTEGYEKKLQILIKNGVVENYTYNEEPYKKTSTEGK